MKNFSKKILRFLLILTVFMITYYCYANSFNAQEQILNLVPTKSGFQKYVEYCSVPKKIYFSFIDDIQNLDENSFNKKWNSA